MASDAWFVVAPAGTSEGTTLSPKVPSNSRVAETAVGSPAYNAWTANGTYQGWEVVMGPFNSAAAAKAAAPPSGLSAILDFLTTGLSALPGLVLNQPAPSAVTSGAPTAAALSSNTGTCVWSVPVVGCVITKTEARALIGGLILGAAGVLGLVGLSLIMISGFEASGAGRAAGGALETVGAGVAFIPGAEGAGLALGAAGSASRRVSSSGSRQSLDRRRSARNQVAQDRDRADRAAAAERRKAERARTSNDD